MGLKVDFHIHTWYSDGSISPTEVVKQAKARDYDMIAITDHDGVDGVKEAMIAGEAVELRVVPGIELATETEEGIGLHILGYHIDIEYAHLKDVLLDLRQKRNRRNETLLTVLANMGYPLDETDLACEYGFVGKLTIARAMAAKGYIDNPKEAFAKGGILESPQARAVKKEKLQSMAAIKLIREAGGIAVLAHPIQIRGMGVPGSDEFYGNVELLVRRLKKAGLGGMECFHPDQSHEQSLRFVELAEKYHLHITEGSDFHGDVIA